MDDAQLRDGFLDLLPRRIGHFQLESGHHGDVWLDLDALFLNPTRLRPFVEALAGQLASRDFAVVCGPLFGVAFLAQAVAAELDAEFVFTERVVTGLGADGRSSVTGFHPDFASVFEGSESRSWTMRSTPDQRCVGRSRIW